MKKVLLSAVILSATMSSAQALEGAFIGFGYNIDSISYEDDNFDISEGTASAVNLSVGYNLNRYIGVELRTLIGATGTESGNYSPTCVQEEQDIINDSEDVPTDQRVDCPNNIPVSQVKFNAQASVNLRVGVPITQYVTMLGKVGYSYSDYTVEKKYYDSDTLSGKINKDLGGETVNVYGEGKFYGLGVGFDLKSGSQIELMYNKNYDDKDISHSSVQLGYNYNF